MMIMEKSSDIAILKAMGAEDAAIERIFAIEGTLIGLAGTAIGVVAGIAVTNQLPWIQDQIEAITGIDTLRLPGHTVAACGPGSPVADTGCGSHRPGQPWLRESCRAIRLPH